MATDCHCAKVTGGDIVRLAIQMYKMTRKDRKEKRNYYKGEGREKSIQ